MCFRGWKITGVVFGGGNGVVVVVYDQCIVYYGPFDFN